VDFRVLGPLSVVDAGREVPIAGRKEKLLLASLLLRANELVPRARLVDQLWEGALPPSAEGALYVLVSHLRSALGPEAVPRSHGGYTLRVEPEHIDSVQFERLARAGREQCQAGDLAAGGRLLREALALWRGPALGELAVAAFALPAAARLEELRVATLEDRIEADLVTGRSDELVGELRALTAEYPHRERLWGQLMRALYARGLQADALDAYRRARSSLTGELGIEPSPPLRLLEQAILRQDPALDASRRRSAPAARLTPPLRRIFGRERELDRLTSLLRRSDVQLITLTGIGGIGKSRLAFETARQLTNDFPDGTFVIELAALADPDLVIPTIAQALGVATRGWEDPAESLYLGLRDRELLLVLDNFDHVLPAAPAVGALLAACARLRVLVTCAAALHVAAEHEFALEPLEVPAETAEPTPESLRDVASVALLVDRAQAARDDFVLTPENAWAVAELCRRLDGLPLAIELAAARTKVLPPAALLGRLRRRLDLAVAERHDIPVRQRTLRATIDSSHSVLDPAEQRLLARLGVFAGGCTLEAVDAVCQESGDVLAEIGGLLDKSFVRRTGEAEPRFWLLETVREYALERLEERGEVERMRARHAQYFTAFAERAESELVGPRQREWLDRLEAEHDNCRAALRWSSDGNIVLNLRLAAALGRFWHMREHNREGHRWLAKAVAVASDQPAWIRAKALSRAGALAVDEMMFDEARGLLEGSLALHRGIDDMAGVALTLTLLGSVAVYTDDLAGAALLFAEAGELYRRQGNVRGVAVSTGNLGLTALNRCDYSRAVELCSEGVELSREVGDTFNLALMLVNLGLAQLGVAEHAAAHASLVEAILLARKIHSDHQIVYAMVGLTALAAAEGADARAAELAGAADALATAASTRLNAADRELNERTIASVRTRLGDDLFAQAWARGTSSELETVA
jgi:predicted ATPase/DNA-binding SARP family transcriptional activator